MLYECQNPIQKIIGIERMSWQAESFDVPPREYSSLTFRLKGTADVTVNGKTCHVGSGEVLYLPQGLPYKAQYSDTEVIAVHFVTEYPDHVPEVYSPHDAEQIHKELVSALLLWQNRAPGYMPRVMSKLYGIFGELCENELKNMLPEHFIRAMSYINANYTDPRLSIDGICKNVAISQTNLRSLFRKYCQKTPVEYITRLRIEYARNLISCGKSVEAAALESGFLDPKYFARVVKKHFNCTPRELKAYGK